MPDSHPFDFDSVPVRARADGWTPARQRRFIDLLAAGCGPSEAAVAVGMTKQTAFALRGRPGAESFCAAWDAAVAYARGRRAAARPGSAVSRGREGVLVPRFYRGRLVRVERRVTNGGMMRLLAQLDRWADKGKGKLPPGIGLDDLLDMLAPRADPPQRRKPRHGSSREALDARFRDAPRAPNAGREEPETDRMQHDVACRRSVSARLRRALRPVRTPVAGRPAAGLYGAADSGARPRSRRRQNDGEMS